jgi:hypothetical protein
MLHCCWQDEEGAAERMSWLTLHTAAAAAASLGWLGSRAAVDLANLLRC